MDNPFNPNQPAGERFFANRVVEVQWLRTQLLASLSAGGAGPQNVAVVGPWGVGKTSLAHRFQAISRGAPFPVVTTFLSCTTGYGDLLGFADALVSAVADEIRARADWPERLRTEVTRWQIEVYLPFFRATRSTPPEAAATSSAELLRRNLRDLWTRYLEPQGAGAAIVLDDAHTLQAMDGQALLILRAVFQDLHLAGARYGLAITGPATLFEDIRDVAEPVTRFFERMALGPFRREDLEPAVCHPLAAVAAPFEVSPGFLDWLWEWTHGHPYFVSFVMRDVVAEAVSRNWRSLTRPLAEQIWSGVRDHLYVSKFEVEWSNATPGERDILRRIASESDGSGEAVRASELPGLNRGLVARLVKKSLVVRADRGEYLLYHPLFGEFVRAAVSGRHTGR